MLHISSTNYHLVASLKKTKNIGHTKCLSLERKKCLKKFPERRQENGPKAEKRENTEGATGPGRITRAYRKVESKDSPEIPDGWGRHQKCPVSILGK